MRIVLGLVTCLTPFAAHAAKYTLADSNGVPSCDVIDIDTTQHVADGVMYRKQCDPRAPTVAGAGVSTKLRGSPDRIWTFSITGTTTTKLYIFDFKGLTWVEYYEAGGQPLQSVGSGVLLAGDNPPH
jgi:hypothetical protein